MQPSVEYWVSAIGVSLLIGGFFGLIALYISAVVGEVKAGKRVFVSFVVVSLLGGLKMIGILFVLLVMPIFLARKKTKERLAQESLRPDETSPGKS